MPSAQIAVDTYAVQHPGTKARRSTQSVAVHLLSLCAVLERDFPPDRSIDLLRHAVGFPQLWHWLHPHTPIGQLTVADVLAQARPGGGALVVRAWAEDVWDAYAPHHSTVRGWLDQVLATWDR
jgi:hypothetical protein